MKTSRKMALLPLCALVLTGPILSVSAAPAVRLGPVSLDAELKAALKTAPAASAWPNSDYVRLLDIGKVTVQSDGTVIGTFRATMKLFNQRARALAEVSLPFNASYQSVKILKARTIKKDGTVLEVKPDDVRVASPYNDYLMYDDAQTIGFSLPGIEDDCVIDYTWQEITRPLLMPGQYGSYWRFNGEEPVQLSRYTLTAPAEQPLKFKSYNDATLAPSVSLAPDGKTKTYVWERRGTQPVTPEPAMPDTNDVYTWMEVSSLDSWQSVAHWFWELARPQMKPSASIRREVARLIAGKTTSSEKARACYDWVAGKTRYVGLEFGLSAFKPHAASEVHDKLYGDCKDKATLLISMLDLAGIKAYPVLLKAGDPRPIEPGLPGLNAFNHCIAQAEIDGRPVWLDATAETCAYGDIPAADRGAQAFVVRDGKGAFQTIPRYAPEENGATAKAAVTLKADGSAEIHAELTMLGGTAQTMRDAVRSLPPDKRREIMRAIAVRVFPGSEMKDFTLPDGDDKYAPFVMKFTASTADYAEATGNLLLLPLLPGSGGSASPFASEKRQWPIVQNDTSLSRSEIVITVPDGFALSAPPADIVLSCPIQNYNRTVKATPDGKTVTIIETVTERPGRVPAENYAQVRTYFAALVKAQRGKLVLQQKP